MGHPQGRWPLGPAWGEHGEGVRSPEAILVQSLHGKRDPRVSRDKTEVKCKAVDWRKEERHE